MAADPCGPGRQSQLAGIVLAAGASSRFGGPKQLARVGGLSLVARAARVAQDFCPTGVIVVTGAYGAEVDAEVTALGLRIAHNAAWADGMAASLRCGIDALPPAAGACLVMLCDQAAVDRADIGSLVSAWLSAPECVAAAHYGATLGVPAIFPAGHWADLRTLTGDRGARSFIAGLAAVTAVAMPHAALDVDTPEDIARLARG